ncbi:hypothetical protein P3S68_014861 [Capsicum galapagoense]
MQNIALTANNLSGKLPTTICDNLPNLEGLYLSFNSIDGVIPPNLEKCRKLQTLSLGKNKFFGTVPRELANLTALTSIFNMSALQLIDLVENKLSVESTVLWFGNNPLDGNTRYYVQFKESWCIRLVKKSVFWFSATMLRNVTSLRKLYLAHNRLNSTLPASLGSLQDLIEFNVSSNLLSDKFHLRVESSRLQHSLICQKIIFLW